MDFVTAGLAYKKCVELLFVHVLQERYPEKIEMYCIIGFECIYPEIVGDLVASVHTDFVVFLGKCLDQPLRLVSLLFNMLYKLPIKEMIPNRFKNPI